MQREERGNASRNAGEKRSYIGSARASGARGDCSHAHTKRDAPLASLTPLTGVAHARNCVIKRARAQRRLKRSVHSRPERRPRVGRASAAFVIRLEMHYAVHSRPQCVGRTVGLMRPIWRVIAAITPMRRPHVSAACVGRNEADYAPTFITRRSASVRRIKNAPHNKGAYTELVYYHSRIVYYQNCV